MSSKFQRNAVITGYLHCYCLVCDFFFESEDGILDHIEEEDHGKQLLAYPYLEKYGDNHIRKVTKGYFCEFCSLLLATAAKVSLHIKEKTHIDNKGLFLLHRSNGLITAFNDIVISESAWHGLDNETCAICNIEYTNEGIHKTEPGHLLNLVQNKVEFGDNNSVFRKTDDSSFQCLTCNSVFALDTIKEHFNDDQHKKLYSKCQEEMKKHAQKTETVEKPTQKAKKEKKDSNQNIVKEAKNECKEIVLKGTVKTEEDERITFAKENSLTYNIGQANTFCRLCEIKLPSSLRCMKEHVNGKEHKSRVAKSTAEAVKPKPKPNMMKRALSKFMQHVVAIENIFHNDSVINEKYCIPQLSFMMITNMGSRFRCQVCEVNMYGDDIDDHYPTPRHKKAMEDTPVIISLPDNEFVREVRPEVYHCGYCNLISPGVDSLTSHLNSGAHREERQACNWRLQRHLPDIRRHRQSQEQDLIRMMFLRHMYS